MPFQQRDKKKYRLPMPNCNIMIGSYSALFPTFLQFPDFADLIPKQYYMLFNSSDALKISFIKNTSLCVLYAWPQITRAYKNSVSSCMCVF
jgi:hypothetical protein